MGRDNVVECVIMGDKRQEIGGFDIWYNSNLKQLEQGKPSGYQEQVLINRCEFVAGTIDYCRHLVEARDWGISQFASQYEALETRLRGVIGQLSEEDLLKGMMRDCRSINEVITEMNGGGTVYLSELVNMLRVFQVGANGDSFEEVKDQVNVLINKLKTKEENREELDMNLLEQSLLEEKWNFKGMKIPKPDMSYPDAVKPNVYTPGRKRWWKERVQGNDDGAEERYLNAIKNRARKIINTIPGMEVVSNYVDSITFMDNEGGSSGNVGMGKVVYREDGGISYIWFDMDTMSHLTEEEMDRLIIHEMLHVRDNVVGNGNELSHSVDNWGDYLWNKRAKKVYEYWVKNKID